MLKVGHEAESANGWKWGKQQWSGERRAEVRHFNLELRKSGKERRRIPARLLIYREIRRDGLGTVDHDHGAFPKQATPTGFEL